MKKSFRVSNATELAELGTWISACDADIKRAYRRLKYTLSPEEDRAELEQLTTTYRSLRRRKRRNDQNE
jgi:hypothetical protein